MSQNTIVVARGDGIGPEITDSVLEILKLAKVPLNYEFIEVGEQVYRSGNTAGITSNAWEKIQKHRVLLKGPITTPQGGGFKSINVTLRKTLGLYANARPCKSYSPYVASHFPKMDLVIIRENEEDLYAGIEHQISPEVVQCLKLITKPGTESIVRYAFEYAKVCGRKKITCMTKDNIMKLTDGAFRKIFMDVSEEYPEIQTEHMIIDIGAAKIAAQPEKFDVIVTLNLYGDIISDIAAEVAGSVGLAGSANIGRDSAMFEAIHGSAPDIAGQGIANPSGMLLSAVQMLVHLGLGSYATVIKNAWLKTLEDGIHTADIFKSGVSKHRASTSEFTKAVLSNLGATPSILTPVQYLASEIDVQLKGNYSSKRELVGADIFLIWDELGRDSNKLGSTLDKLSLPELKLKMISNRGVMVYPGAQAGIFCSDSWRCRFLSSGEIPFSLVLSLLEKLTASGLVVQKVEGLAYYDGKPEFSLAQGE